MYGTCMEYLSTFTVHLSQMYVNFPYINMYVMGDISKIVYTDSNTDSKVDQHDHRLDSTSMMKKNLKLYI